MDDDDFSLRLLDDARPTRLPFADAQFSTAVSPSQPEAVRPMTVQRTRSPEGGSIVLDFGLFLARVSVILGARPGAIE